MPPTSLSQLFLAYRHAKHALFQEQRGMTRLDCAMAEDHLPQFLAGVSERLRKSPGWFKGEPLGELWLVPKRLEPISREKGVSIIGEASSAPARLHVRLHLVPTPSFATVEVLWMWQFGPALELLLGPYSYGNRLRIVDGTVDVRARGPFAFWPRQYERFREGTFDAARGLLVAPGRSCVLATFDLASCYDSIDPSFLVASDFVREVRSRATRVDVSFDEAEYLRATRTLLQRLREYQRRAGQMLGVTMQTGLPIGALSSGLIANLALAPLDEHILSIPGVRHYARYVDDILLVVDGEKGSSPSVLEIARRHLPVSEIDKQGRIVLNSRALGRPGSVFSLSSSKLRVYSLRGRRGLDFLRTIERDVRWIASERRAFLKPDGLGTDSAIAALVAGSDTNAPVQVLREVDRLKVERYAAGVQLGKLAVGVEMLSPSDAQAWCQRQIRSLAGMLTDADSWADFAELTFRALATCLRATDYETARLILSRHRRRLRQLLLKRDEHPLQWGATELTKVELRSRLAAWFQMRHTEVIAASLRLELLDDTKAVQAVLDELRSSVEAFRYDLPDARAVRVAALLFARCDLRTADRENDRRHGYTDDGAAKRANAARSLSSSVRRGRSTSTIAADALAFLDASEAVGDPVYKGATFLDLMLMTRPPTSFDIQIRFAMSGRLASDAVRTTNALRGTNYLPESVRGVPGRELDVTTPLFLLQHQSEIAFLLGNLRTNEEWFDRAAKGTPHLGSERLDRLAAVVNSALKKARKLPMSVLVLPELSVPRSWLRPLAGRLTSEGLSAVVGLEYERVGRKVFNHAVAVMATGRHGSAVALWRKGRPAREEDKLLSQRSLELGDSPTPMPMVVRTDGGIFSVLICSELLDVELRSSLIGRIDILVVPAWNKDTATFDHTVQTVANDLHCYVAVANNAVYSDCRVFAPKHARHERDVCRLICRTEDDAISAQIDVGPLRAFQSMSLADREFPPKHPEPKFKAVPPAYKNKR